jgi:hypothetical protein
MPNWCSNHITVRGTDSAEIQRLAKALADGEFCNAVIPVPEILKDTTSPVQPGDEEAAEARRKACGYTDWYSFQTSRWGTKWDVGCDSVEIDEDGLGFNGHFDSAWSPPMGVVEQMVEDGLEVTLYYYESGMGFVGKYEDGCDEFYEYGGENSSTVAAVIGDELDDFFGISESMREYEEENEEEELTEWLKDGIETRKLETL